MFFIVRELRGYTVNYRVNNNVINNDTVNLFIVIKNANKYICDEMCSVFM